MTSQSKLLLGYQRRWCADNRQVVVWEKARRIGATWCDAADSVLTAAAANNSSDVLYISYNEDMTREYVECAAGWARALQIAASEAQETIIDGEEDLKVFRVDFATGRKILGMSSRPRNLRGKQGKIVIDEAAFHDDLDGLLKAAMAMLIWGGRVRVISTHHGRESEFNRLVKSIRAGELDYGLHRTTFADAVGDGLYNAVKARAPIDAEFLRQNDWVANIRQMHGRHAGEELDVMPSARGEGIVKLAWFGRYDEQPATFERVVMSCDTANKTKRTNDPSSVTVWGQTKTGYYLLYVWAERQEYPALKRTIKSIAGQFEPDALLIEDASSGASLIQELRADTSLPVIAIQATTDKQTRFESVSHLIEAGRVFLPDAAPWLPSYESELTEFPDSAHDDQVDSTSQALRWMHRSRQFASATSGVRESFGDVEHAVSRKGWGSVAVERPF